jgi:hypothetical protein
LQLTGHKQNNKWNGTARTAALLSPSHDRAKDFSLPSQKFNTDLRKMQGLVSSQVTSGNQTIGNVRRAGNSRKILALDTRLCDIEPALEGINKISIAGKLA